jgi:PAS domain S-box-containing protein
MAYQFRLKSKITIAVSVLVISLMSTVAFIMFSYFEQQLKATIAQDQFVMVTGLAGEIDKTLTAAHNQLIDAALRIPQEVLDDPDRAQDLLDSMTGLQRIFDNRVSILTPEGKVFAESPFVSDRRGFDLSFRLYYKDTVATKKPVISDPYISSQAQKHPLVMMTAPVFNKNGVLVGILLGAMDLMGDNILQDISEISLGRAGYLFLTTRETRIIIMHPDAKRIFESVPPGTNLLYDKAVNGFEGTGETVNSSGLPMLTSFKHLKVNGWILGSSYPISEAHEKIYNLKKKIFVSATVGIICILIMVYYLIKYLTHPLVAFTHHVEALPGKIGKDKHLDIGTHDEIGTLSHAFNRMITELDRQTEALQKSEEQYRTIFDSANDSIFIQDIETGGILDVNQKMCEMYGYSREEAQQIDVGVLSAGEPPYTIQDAKEWILRAAQGEPQHFEWKAKDKAGRVFWVDVKMRRVEIDSMDRLLVTVRDITERKQAQEALHEAEKRLSQIIKATSVRR